METASLYASPANTELADEGYEPYRAISHGAVASLVLSLISVAGLAFPAILVAGVVAFLLGIGAYRTITRYPLEWTGKPLALIGLILSPVVVVSGATKHTYDYLTEVPDGYVRISFDELQPSASQPDLPISPGSLELQDKKVFVKGYVYPDGQKNNIKKFILVPDMGTCCFGGQPKLTDMIEVTLEEPLRVEYSFRKRKLGGQFHVDREMKPVAGVTGVYYQLKADVLK